MRFYILCTCHTTPIRPTLEIELNARDLFCSLKVQINQTIAPDSVFFPSTHTHTIHYTKRAKIGDGTRGIESVRFVCLICIVIVVAVAQKVIMQSKTLHLHN